jgi:hypothetical protein
MSNKVFTVYNCGTAYHRDKHDVIANLNRETASPHHVNDGVGSGTPVVGGVFGHRENPGSWSTPGGLIWGAGAGDIVEATVDLVGKRFRTGTLDTLNMCGWSRGAVLCFKIANHLAQQKDLGRIAVNIFAIDPVPGLKKNHMWEDVTLSGNVKTCVIVLAQHDLRGNTFRPLVPTLDGKQSPYDIMPGDHAALVEAADDGRRADASFIVHAWAKAVLAAHGTQFKDATNLTIDQYLVRYAHLRAEFDDYLIHAKGRHDKYFKNLDDERQVYSAAGVELATIPSRHGEPTFFINRHESVLFGRAYPRLAAELKVRAAQRFLPFGRAKVPPTERFANDLNRLYKRTKGVWAQIIEHIGEVEAWRAKLPKK